MTHRLPQHESTQFFSRLTPTQFEELCYDLIIRLGFERVAWRKGSSGEHSPSDGSRDFEAFWPIIEADGFKTEQLWLIDAKHITISQGLNRTKVADFLALRAINPDAKLLIMTSGYISNPLRDEIKSIGEKKVRVWERHQLIAFISRYHELMHKYDLSENLDYLVQYHPLHVLWMREVPITTDIMVSTAINVCKEIDNDTIDHVLFEFYDIMYVKKHTNLDLMDKYKELRNVSRLLAGRIIIDRILQVSFRRCDSTKIEWQRRVFEDVSAKFPDSHTAEMLRTLDERQQESRLKYVQLCETLLPLIFEAYNDDLEKRKLGLKDRSDQ